MQGNGTKPSVGAGSLGVDRWPTSLAFEIKRYTASAAHSTVSDYYLVALGILLAGYAIFAKAFAYISVGPVYIGDLVLAIGILAFLKSRCEVATLATLPSLLLGILLGWAVIRTLPSIREFGVDAMRDSAIIVYSGFAFIIVALLLERPERLALIISCLRVVGSIVILAAPLLMVLVLITPNLHIYIKPSLLAIHLTGAALLMLLGFRRASVGWLIFLFIGMALASTQNRGGMFAIIVSLTFALIATGRWRKLAVIVVISAGLLGLFYLLDLSLPGSDARDISARQLVENLSSVFGSSDTSNLEATKDWRLAWWKTIFGYTFEGPYFWTGKGFGTNLALVDGFVVGEDPNLPLLRSPHSSHFSILARLGVPGLALWLLTLGAWSAMLLVNTARARRCGDNAWADLFVFIFCYGLAFIIDSTFNVSLEGPHAGIWFWNLFGVGIGATMIYSASPRGLAQMRRKTPLNQSGVLRGLEYGAGRPSGQMD